MPDFVTLYTYNPPPSPFPILRTVFRSTTDPTYISYSDVGATGSSPQPPADTIVSRICQPGTFDQYTYKVKTSPPYAYYEKTPNSSECGYTPPVCDLTKVSFAKTDETDIGANDGTANLFCTTSYPTITYYLATNPPIGSQVIIQTNTTGYFTGIAPGPYVIIAEDANSCQLREFFTIIAFSTDYTHYKYRLLFKDASGLVQWELQLYDMKHSYLKTEYPKDVVGNEDPVIMSIGDPNEDKFTSIISRQLDITLEYTGLDFTPDEFSLAPENSWYVQLLKDGGIEFKGYILPDEIQNFYADAPYLISLKATDGLPSLKGNLFGDGSGGQGYGTYQIQQYGLTRWCLLVKQCLDQLGYDYGNTHVISSLRYNSLFTSSLWGNIGTWSDILYDGSGVPVNTYDALAMLLSGMKLTIFQHKGEYYLVNWNDLWYINNGVVATEYGFCFYFFPPDFNTSITGGDRPEYTVLGFDQAFKPVHPPQNINYDKAYNIENDISFNTLALLYENPSFEIGAVQGHMPPGFQRHGSIGNVAYCNYDPLDPSNPQIGAADGSWELREDWIYVSGVPGYLDVMQNYIDLIDPIVVDQPGLLVNVSFQWRPKQVPGLSANTVPVYAIMFTTGGVEYMYVMGGIWDVFTEPPTAGQIGDLSFPDVSTNGDYTSWQSYSIQTKPLPGSGIGELNIRFYPPFSHNVGAPYPADGVRFICDIDVFNITTSSSNPAAVQQIGEKHISTIVTGVPNSDMKQQQLNLFTYPANKRVAGNIFIGSDYATATIANLWSFALKTLDKPDRLPATITKAYARQYWRCMNKFEGEISAPYMSFYSVFGLRFMDGVLFVAFSIESHLRTNIHHITLIEINDADAQVIYSYVPEYERSARSN